MSKKRPRNDAAAPPAADSWLARVYHNTFTYRGRRRAVRRWHVKLQHAGRRRTFTLQAADRAAAAAEARELHRRLLAEGWAAVRPVAAARSAPEAAGGPPRLTLRRYTAGLTPGLAQQYFIRLPHGGVAQHFALGSADPNTAALRAQEVLAEAARAGLRQVALSWPREITAAVIWQANPFLCTYATMLTVPAHAPVPPAPVGAGWTVAVVEEDGAVRRALAQWAARNAGVGRVVTAPDAGALADALPAGGAAVVLAGRALADQPALRTALAAAVPRAVPLPFGVYAESDDIFASITGVSGGYYLRRRPPERLLEPLARAPLAGGAEGLRRQVRLYVQRQFADPAAAGDEGSAAGELTPREAEVLELLARGHLDKEVARVLGLSVWTIHSHLRRIFAKYGVHTRTEAVVKYLQK